VAARLGREEPGLGREKAGSSGEATSPSLEVVSLSVEAAADREEARSKHETLELGVEAAMPIDKRRDRAWPVMKPNE